jgi:hypothetical protein
MSERVKGFSNIKGDDNYWLDAVRDFWAETGLTTDSVELEEIVNWFDMRRVRLKWEWDDRKQCFLTGSTTDGAGIYEGNLQTWEYNLSHPKIGLICGCGPFKNFQFAMKEVEARLQVLRKEELSDG